MSSVDYDKLFETCAKYALSQGWRRADPVGVVRLLAAALKWWRSEILQAEYEILKRWYDRRQEFPWMPPTEKEVQDAAAAASISVPTPRQQVEVLREVRAVPRS